MVRAIEEFEREHEEKEKKRQKHIQALLDRLNKACKRTEELNLTPPVQRLFRFVRCPNCNEELECYDFGSLPFSGVSHYERRRTPWSIPSAVLWSCVCGYEYAYTLPFMC